MSESMVTERKPLETVWTFIDACTRGVPDSAGEVLHPQIHYRALIANGHSMEERGRDSVLREFREFVDHNGKPEVVHQTIERIGPYVRWSTCWRVRRDGEPSLFEWYALLKVEDGRITRFDEVCTGRVPQA
jgi:ketosteroid isomerase-like protein